MIVWIISFLSTFMTIMWSSIFLLFHVFGFRLQKVNGIKLRTFCKRITIASVWCGDEPDQWIIGFPFIGYIYSSHTNHGDERTLYLFSSKKWYQVNINGIIDTNNNNNNNKVQDKQITLYERQGSYFNLQYESRIIKFKPTNPYEIQQNIIQQIITEYKINNYATCLLYGQPGNGKSTIPLLLANYINTKMQLDVSLCDSFNPTDPADTFQVLYSKVNPDENKPLILVIEEIDCIIDKIHNGKIVQHKYIPVQLTCKSDWSKLFDNFDKGYYDHTIIIMTSNKSIDWFNELDPSYFRDKRVSLKFEV